MVDFKLKSINSDFEVEEIPLIPQLLFEQTSCYTYLWIEKSGFTTFEAEDIIKNYFKVHYSDIAAQGLKDENAKTRQILSIKKILSTKDLSSFNSNKYQDNKSLKIEKIIGLGNEPVYERSLHGNSFKITIRNLDQEIATDLYNFSVNNRPVSFINYYDMQRFGMDGGPYNTDSIGKAIIENDWKNVYLEFKKNSKLFS